MGLKNIPTYRTLEYISLSSDINWIDIRNVYQGKENGKYILSLPGYVR